ncbi:MAG: cytochrome c oxidase assembly protein [Thermoleophilia bacterium]
MWSLLARLHDGGASIAVGTGVPLDRVEIVTMHGGETHVPLSDVLPVVAIASAAALYGLRAAHLARRGRPVPIRKAILFGVAMLVLIVAVVSPVHDLGERRLFSMHMVQHLLIGDIAPVLAVLGLSRSLLRNLLAMPGASTARLFTRPLTAALVWSLNMTAWHVPPLYDAALRSDLVHSLAHVCFFVAGMLLWSSVLQLVPDGASNANRVGALAVAWVVGGVLSNVLVWSGRVYYSAYVDAPTTWGLSHLDDQRLGGGIMLIEMTLVMGSAAVWLAMTMFADAERRQRQGPARTAGGSREPRPPSRNASHGRGGRPSQAPVDR